MTPQRSAALRDALAVTAEIRAKRDAKPASLFDAPIEAIIARPAESNGPEWRTRALAALRTAAGRSEFLTVDDVRDGMSEADLATYDLRGLGDVLRRGAREGLIERVPSAFRSSRHCRHPVAVWRSLLDAEGPPQGGSRPTPFPTDSGRRKDRRDGGEPLT